jgi:hypothetical protein
VLSLPFVHVLHGGNELRGPDTHSPVGKPSMQGKGMTRVLHGFYKGVSRVLRGC